MSTDEQSESAEQLLGRRIREQLNEGGDLAAELRRAYDEEHGDQDGELTEEEQLGHQIAGSVKTPPDPFHPEQPELTEQDKIRADLDAANQTIREMRERYQQ